MTDEKHPDCAMCRDPAAVLADHLAHGLAAARNHKMSIGASASITMSAFLEAWGPDAILHAILRLIEEDAPTIASSIRPMIEEMYAARVRKRDN